MLSKLLSLLMVLFLLGYNVGCSSIEENESQNQEESFADDEDFGDEGEDDFSDEEEVADEDSEGEDDFGDDFADEEGEEEAEELSEEEGLEEEEDYAEELDDESEGLEEEQSQEEESLAQQAQELEEEQPEEVVEEIVEEEPVTPVETMSESPRVSVQNIKFLSNERGGTIVVETSAPSQYTTRFNEENNQMVIEIPNSILPQQLTRPFITNEFKSGKFAGVNAYQNPGGNTSRIVVQLKGNERPFISAEGNSIFIIPAGGSTEAVTSIQTEEAPEYTEADRESFDVETARADEMKALKAQNLDDFLVNSNTFYGRKISIETGKEADVRDVLNFIGEQSGANLIISEDVSGSIQIKVKDIPWDQALLLILKSKKLGYVRQGNVIRIATLTELESEASQSSRVLESRKSLSPLYLKVVPISYANVKDLSAQIKPFMSGDRASVIADERTSSLIIKETQESLEKVLRLIKELDAPPTQVMIQGKIIEATTNFTRNLGREFTADVTSGGNTFNFGFSGANDAAGSFSASILSGTNTINAFLSMEERLDRLKVISSPRVVTMNNKEATIEQKGEIISVETTTDTDGNKTTKTNARTFTLTLKVKPQITSDGGVLMDVDVAREFPGALVPGTTERPINSRAAKTSTMVKNGQTAVIGGIFENDSLQAESGITFLKDIPILGWMFKSNTRDEKKTELVIFLTPQVLDNDYVSGLDLGAGDNGLILDTAEDVAKNSVSDEDDEDEDDEEDEEDDEDFE